MAPMRYAIIRNAESNKNVAVVIHDSNTGRVVFKCRPTDWPLQRSFDLWIDRPIIIQEPIEFKTEHKFVARRKVVRFDNDYLRYLLDRMIKRPYEVRSVVDSKSTIRLDDFVDRMSQEVL